MNKNSKQDISWETKIRLKNIVGSIKNNTSQVYCWTQLNLQFDLEIIPKGSSTESDHSVGVVDGWSRIERDWHCETGRFLSIDVQTC
jgi:hypothetical protein